MTDFLRKFITKVSLFLHLQSDKSSLGYMGYHYWDIWAIIIGTYGLFFRQVVVMVDLRACLLAVISPRGPIFILHLLLGRLLPQAVALLACATYWATSRTWKGKYVQPPGQVPRHPTKRIQRHTDWPNKILMYAYVAATL